MARFENPIEHTCDVVEGQQWVSVDGQCPEGMCPAAWDSMREFVESLARGEGNFYDGWMKNPMSAMISCNSDGGEGFWMLFMRLLVADAVHKGAKHIIMGLGGSATSDAGIGMLRALIDAFAKHGGIPERYSPTRSLWDDIKELKHEIFQSPWRELNVYAIGQIERENPDGHIIEVPGKGYVIAVPYCTERK